MSFLAATNSIATLVGEEKTTGNEELSKALDKPAKEEQEEAPKPRRRLRDTLTDHADGLNVLIQKTKAFNIEPDGIEALALGEDETSWLHALYSNDISECLWGVQKIRKYVCGDNSEIHAQNLISWNVLGRLIWFLQPTLPDNLLFEALWILTNIAAGPTIQTNAIVESGFLPFLVPLLSHPTGAVRTQAAWAVGNIIGDREGFRDLVLQEGTLAHILKIWEGDFPDESHRKEAFRIAMWVVDNMCRYKPDWHQMGPVFDLLPSVLHQQDPFLLKECCWAIARILHQSGRHPAIDTMITAPMCHRLIEILGFNNMLTTHPVLRALINLSSSKNTVHLEYIIDGNLLPHLRILLTEHFLPKNCRASLQIFVVQILGNIASNKQYAPLIIEESPDNIPLGKKIVEILAKHEDPELKIEACVCIRNLLYYHDDKITSYLVKNKVIPTLLEYLPKTSLDSKIRLTTVEAIIHIAEASIDKEYSSPISLTNIHSQAQTVDGFNVLLNALQTTSGRELDQMDEDGPVEYVYDDVESSDDDDDQHIAEKRAMHSKKTPNRPILTLKQQIESKLYLLLSRWFTKEFHKRVQNAQIESQFYRGFDDLSMDTKKHNSAFDELVQNFQTIFQDVSK